MEERSMYDWKEYNNFYVRTNDDKSITHIIIIDGNEVEVDEEVYAVYKKGAHKMKHMEINLKIERYMQDENGKAAKDHNGIAILLPEREISYEQLISEDWEFASSESTPEETLFPATGVDERILLFIDSLTDDEKDLIKAIYYDELYEREYAEKTGVSQQAIHDRKQRILKKIEIFCLQPCF